MSSSVESAIATETRCASCGNAFTGRFCPACGEEVLDHHDLSIRHFLNHTVLHEFTHVDGKIGRTVRSLLFRPGFLTSEYFAGRRGLYLNPLRILLTAAILFALAGQFGKISLGFDLTGFGGPKVQLSMLPPPPPHGEDLEKSVKAIDVTNLLGGELESVKKRVDIKDKVVVEKFNRLMEGYGEVLTFCSVIPLALVLWLIYRKSKPYFVEHLVFSLHLESFFLLLAIVVYGSFNHIPDASHLGRPVLVLIIIVGVGCAYLAQAWYMHSSLMRFYHPEAFVDRYRFRSGVAWRTGLAGLVLFLANSLFLSLVHMIGAVIALWRL